MPVFHAEAKENRCSPTQCVMSTFTKALQKVSCKTASQPALGITQSLTTRPTAPAGTEHSREDHRHLPLSPLGHVKDTVHQLGSRSLLPTASSPYHHQVKGSVASKQQNHTVQTHNNLETIRTLNTIPPYYPHIQHIVCLLHCVCQLPL